MSVDCLKRRSNFGLNSYRLLKKIPGEEGDEINPVISHFLGDLRVIL
jgi:hypothetical protein